MDIQLGSERIFALQDRLGASKMITRDALFDIGADTVGLLVPGGSLAVKVARAALDKSY